MPGNNNSVKNNSVKNNSGNSRSNNTGSSTISHNKNQQIIIQLLYRILKEQKELKKNVTTIINKKTQK